MKDAWGWWTMKNDCSSYLFFCCWLDDWTAGWLDGHGWCVVKRSCGFVVERSFWERTAVVVLMKWYPVGNLWYQGVRHCFEAHITWHLMPVGPVGSKDNLISRQLDTGLSPLFMVMHQQASTSCLFRFALNFYFGGWLSIMYPYLRSCSACFLAHSSHLTRQWWKWSERLLLPNRGDSWLTSPQEIQAHGL